MKLINKFLKEHPAYSFTKDTERHFGEEYWTETVINEEVVILFAKWYYELLQNNIKHREFGKTKNCIKCFTINDEKSPFCWYCGHIPEGL